MSKLATTATSRTSSPTETSSISIPAPTPKTNNIPSVNISALP